MPVKKKGYFFLLDAMLGLSVIAIGAFLILSLYISSPEPTQVGFLADDLLNFLSNTRIKDLNNNYAGIGGALWRQGEITDGDNYLLQQIGEFYTANKLDIVEKFIQNISADTVPAQFSHEVWIDSRIVYPKNPSAAHIKSKDNTGLLLTSKKITFGIMNRSTSALWGPYKAEVFVWQKY